MCMRHVQLSTDSTQCSCVQLLIKNRTEGIFHGELPHKQHFVGVCVPSILLVLLHMPYFIKKIRSHTEDIATTSTISYQHTNTVIYNTL